MKRIPLRTKTFLKETVDLTAALSRVFNCLIIYVSFPIRLNFDAGTITVFKQTCGNTLARAANSLRWSMDEVSMVNICRPEVLA